MEFSKLEWQQNWDRKYEIFTLISLCDILLYWYHYVIYLYIDIIMWYTALFVNCNWVDTRWQKYSTHLHISNTQNNTVENFGWKAFWDSNQNGQTKINDELAAYIYRLIGKSARCAPSLRVIPWHLPYNWGKSWKNPQVRVAEECQLTRRVPFLEGDIWQYHKEIYDSTIRRYIWQYYKEINDSTIRSYMTVP